MGGGAPSLAVSGDVGVLADENAQRLVSIFMEAGMSCLQNLRDVVENGLRSKAKDLSSFSRLYSSGLASILNWSSEMLQGEVADMEAQYPETRKLHQFVFVSILSEAAYSNVAVGNFTIPSVPETYHAFLRRIVSSHDVRKGVAFMDSPLFQKRVVFLDCFRNAYHDMARRYASSQADLPVVPSLIQKAAHHQLTSSAEFHEGLLDAPETKLRAAGGKIFSAATKSATSAAASSELESKPSKNSSRLRRAMMEEAQGKEPADSKVPASVVEDKEGPGDSKEVYLLDSLIHSEEPKNEEQKDASLDNTSVNKSCSN